MMRALVLAAVLMGGLLAAAFGAAPPAPAPDERVAPPLAAGLAIEFIRARGSVAFDVIVTTSDGAALPSAVTINVNRGVLGAPRRVGAALRARVTPDGSGHYIVTASAGARQARRIALVLGGVDEMWNQPEPVPGLVNTLGWEDGASISADGQTLSVQYLPVSISCLFGGDPSDTRACRVRGPVTAPDRPDIPGADRVSGTSYLNGCPSVGVPSLPFPVPPNSVFAFTRRANGAFASPRPWFIEGADGCLSMFGAELQEDNATLIYAFDDAAAPGVGPRLFSQRIVRANANALARYEPGPVLVSHPGVPLGGASGGRAGNPHRAELGDGRTLVFFDDEEERQDLFVSVARPGRPFAPARRVPAPVSVAGEQESQPFFDGERLFFRRGGTILASVFSGGDPLASASWGPTRAMLTPGDEPVAGAVFIVGEPSVATALSRREFYFVYGRRAADGTFDLDIAMVRAR